MPNDPNLVPIILYPAQWPDRTYNHILERVKARDITMADLVSVREWGETFKPHVGPTEKWFRPFPRYKPKFYLCGTGQFPSTVRTYAMGAKGRRLAFMSKFLLAA